MARIQKSDLVNTLIMAVISAGVGAIYTRIAYLSRPDAEGTILLGMFLGALIGGGISFFEFVFVSKPDSKFRRMPFWMSLILRAFIYSMIVLLSRFIGQTINHWVTGYMIMLIGANQRDTITDLGFTLFLSTVLLFIMQVRNFIGGSMLTKLIFGRYNKPRVEQRIFMILDLVGSTKIAQQLGDIRFHEFLNRIFILVDDPINQTRGEVHSYVGDSIFAVWPYSENKTKNSRPLKALLAIDKLVAEHATELEKQFGIKPEVRMALHKGKIVAGETGYRKRQITYLGNTINLTSRIESLTKTGVGTYLASKEYLETCDIPDSVHIEALGEFELKGSSTPMAIDRISID